MKRKLNKKRTLAFIIALFSSIKVMYELWILPENTEPGWLTIGLAFLFYASAGYVAIDYELKKEKKI